MQHVTTCWILWGWSILLVCCCTECSVQWTCLTLLCVTTMGTVDLCCMLLHSTLSCLLMQYEIFIYIRLTPIFVPNLCTPPLPPHTPPPQPQFLGICHLLYFRLHPSNGLPVHVQPWWLHAWICQPYAVLFQCQPLPGRQRNHGSIATWLPHWDLQVGNQSHFRRTVITKLLYHNRAIIQNKR